MASTAEGVRWDLSRAFADADAARGALARARDLAAELERRAEEVSELSPAELRALLDEASAVAELRDALDPGYGYPGLRVLADDGDGGARDLAAECEAGLQEVRAAVRAIEVAVGAGPQQPDAPELGPYAFWVGYHRGLARYALPPEAERAFAARAATASAAWGRLSQEILTTAGAELDAGGGARRHGVVELQQLLRHDDRDLRRRAWEALQAIYEEALPVSAACLDAVVADRVAEDRLRGRPDAMTATIAADGVDPATVERVLAVTERLAPSLLARWHERKRQALGVERLERHDRYAPVGEPVAIAWQDAVEACVTALEGLAPGLGALARAAVDERRVDAEVRPGKDGGTFCSPLPLAHGVWVFLSYLDAAKGATDLAHELGHSTHYEHHAAAVPWLVAAEPSSAAFFEVPSTLTELVVAEHLHATLGGEAGKAVLRGALEGTMSLAFGAVVLTRFEQDACATRAAGRVLTPERIVELWSARAEAMEGPLAERLGLLEWPHPFTDRFYGYQYTYATLAALALLDERRADPERFAGAYLPMLAAMGTGTPAQLLARCGLDVGDATVWERGFAELERLCDLAW